MTNDEQSLEVPWPDHVIELATNSITLSVRVAGSGPAVVLAHGFPETGYSWRHQVPALVAAGHRVIVPDMRGYGLSDRPAEAESYGAENVGRDLIGLLDALGDRDAVFVGHDWGAACVWPLALSHPERVRAVAGLSVPFGPPAPVAPTQIMRKRLGDDFDMLQFQQQGPPEEEPARDVQATMTATMASVPLTVDGTFEGAELPGWLSDEELAVYVQAFTQSGFRGGLNYYRNIDRNWEHSVALSKPSSNVPSMFLTGSLDPVRSFMPSDRLGDVFSRHRPEIVIEGAGHWVQQRRASEVNEALIDFLSAVINNGISPREDHHATCRRTTTREMGKLQIMPPCPAEAHKFMHSSQVRHLRRGGSRHTNHVELGEPAPRSQLAAETSPGTSLQPEDVRVER